MSEEDGDIGTVIGILFQHLVTSFSILWKINNRR